MAEVHPKSLDDRVQFRKDKQVATIKVDRPERKNAMTAEMSETFAHYLVEVRDDPDIRALIITGTDDAFLSGADVGTVTAGARKMEPATWKRFRDLIYRNFYILYSMGKPTIAAVNGAAVVGGVDVAVSCDIRLASTNARFRVGFRRVALMPTPAICYLLPRLIGPGWTKLLAFTDRFLDAAEAQRIGLVEEVVPPEQLMPRASELAAELASGPSMMISATKEAMSWGLGLDFQALRRHVDNAQFALTRTDDHEEAMAAFADKRQPVFQGR